MLNQLSLKSKLLLLCGVLSCITMTVGAVAVTSLYKVGNEYGFVAQKVTPKLVHVSGLLSDYRRLRINIITLAITGLSERDKEFAIKTAVQSINDFTGHRADYVNLGFIDGQKQLFDAMDVAWEDFEKSAREVIERVGALHFVEKNNTASPGTNYMGIIDVITSGAGGTFGFGGDLRFLTKADDGAYGERMRIMHNGNVGIGTTSPTEKLDVAGHARVSGSVINGGMDFVLGNSDQVSRGNSGRSRALVKDAGTTLVVNYNGDFSGGTRFDGASGSPNFFVSGAANGNVGIGITNPTYKLQVNGQPAANGFTAFTNYSDRRLKTDIHPIEDNVLEKVLALNPSQFSYNNKYYDLTGYEKSEQSQQMKGFVAQELQEVFPDMVHEKEVGGETYLDTNLSSLQIYLVKAFREFYDKFTRTTETHSREIASMKAENAQLKVNDAAKDDKIKRLEQESAAKAKEMSELKAYLCAKDPKAPICK